MNSMLNSQPARLLDSGRSVVTGLGELVVRWIPLGIVVVLWDLSSGYFVSEAVFPPPAKVFDVMVTLTTSGEIVPILQVSLWRVVYGLSLSVGVGILLGIGMARSNTIENIFDVFLALLYPLPKVALVPLAILWFGVGTQSVVFIIFLACLLPVIINTYNAASTIDEELIWSARMMGSSDRRLFIRVVFPAATPGIMTGIRQAIPISFIALIAAELLTADRGIGFKILQSGQLGNYTRMMAYILLISIVAYIATWAFEGAERRVMAWN